VEGQRKVMQTQRIAVSNYLLTRRDVRIVFIYSTSIVFNHSQTVGFVVEICGNIVYLLLCSVCTMHHDSITNTSLDEINSLDGQRIEDGRIPSHHCVVLFEAYPVVIIDTDLRERLFHKDP